MDRAEHSDVDMALIHSLSYVEGRYLVMVMPIILLLTASGMMALRVFEPVDD